MVQALPEARIVRKIRPSQILVFLVLLALACTLAWGTNRLALDSIPLGEYRAIAKVAGFVLFLYAWALALFRGFMAAFPLPIGEIAEGSRAEFVYHVYVLFFLLLFYPVIRSGIPPAPFMRLFYQALGARLGANTYSQGIIHDPLFVEIGRDSVVGQGALLVPHVIEGSRLAHYPILIGNNVTIGANSVVLSDVEIADRAMVASGSVVQKGSRIGPGEIWGGVPARLIGKVEIRSGE